MNLRLACSWQDEFLAGVLKRQAQAVGCAPQVAIAVGRCWPSICARCYTGGALMREDLHELGMMLCEHRHSRHGGASLTLVDKRQARLTDRFSLLHQGVHPHITTSAKREHYVFTRRARL